MPFYAFAVICRIFRDAKSRAPPILSTRLYLYRDKDTTLHCLFTKKSYLFYGYGYSSAIFLVFVSYRNRGCSRFQPFYRNFIVVNDGRSYCGIFGFSSIGCRTARNRHDSFFALFHFQRFFYRKSVLLLLPLR